MDLKQIPLLEIPEMVKSLESTFQTDKSTHFEVVNACLTSGIPNIQTLSHSVYSAPIVMGNNQYAHLWNRKLFSG